MRGVKRNKKRTHFGIHGFTLVEVMVVLVILGLISLLLTQMLGFGFSLRERVLSYTISSRDAYLAERWFCQSLQASYPGVSRLEPSLAGSEHEVSALSLAALDEDAGSPANIGWLLVSDAGVTRLQYVSQDGESWDALSWQGTGQFWFLDDTGNWSEQWPTRFGSRNGRLPGAVMLNAVSKAGKFTWVAHISGSREPRTPMSEELPF